MGLRVEINNDFGVGKNNNMSADTKKIVDRFEKNLGIKVTKFAWNGRENEYHLNLPNGKASFKTAQIGMEQLKRDGVISQHSELKYIEGQGGKAVLSVPNWQ